MDFKGQGAVEYLLLIGGAILLAALVLALLGILGGSSATRANDKLNTFFNAID